MTSSSSIDETAASVALVDVSINNATTGEFLCGFQLPSTATIKKVKLRLWEMHGMHLFSQNLLCASEGILKNDQEIGLLGSRLDLQLILRRLDYEKGASLWEPAIEGAVGHVKQILSDAADPDHAQAADRWTALIAAAVHGHSAVVRCLCEAGADKDKAMHDGTTPLFMASQQGHLELVQYLCEAGADKDKAKQDGATPVYIASQEGHLEVVRYLCKAGADKKKARQDGNGQNMTGQERTGQVRTGQNRQENLKKTMENLLYSMEK